MSFGPLGAYAPPGVYTRTLTETNAANFATGLRIPALIGVGTEELEQLDLELVRGSSSQVDQKIFNEDVTHSWVVDSTNPNNPLLGEQDGTYTTVKIRNFPIVDGEGFGRTTNDVRNVSVVVNNLPVAVGAVNGTKGLVTLQVPTQPNDVVRVTYFFHRGDTSFTDDLSQQVTAGNASLTSPGFEPFVVSSGSNDQFILTANGTQATITLPAGSLTAANVVTAINASLVPNLSASVFTDNNNKKQVKLTTTMSLVIGSGTANGILGFTAGAATSRNRDFRVFQRPIVDGTSGGTTTTDTSKVVVKVNGTQVIPESVDGANGIITLPFAPPTGAVVSAQYWANTWQDTFDYLPNSLVTTVLRSGISPGRNDYVQGVDFVVSNPSSDVSVINWGSSVQVAAGNTTIGATPFDSDLGGQIVGTLIDDKIFLAPCERVTDTSTIPATISPTDYLLPEVPTTGNGRDQALGTSVFTSVANSRQDLTTNRPDLIKVYTGRSLADALNRPAVAVTTVDGDNRRISLKTAQPADYKAYATFYYSRMSDDSVIVTNQVAGPVGAGQYTLFSTTQDKSLFSVRWGSKTGLSQIVQWPRGSELVPDAFHAGGKPVSEVVTVEFGNSDPTNAAYTIKGAAPYSFYKPFSATWVTKVNGSDISTNLAAGGAATMVGARVELSGGAIVIPASATLNVKVNGNAHAIALTSGPQTPSFVAGEIATALGADGTATFKAIGATAGFFVITSAVVPSNTLPAGFDDVSSILIEDGSVEEVLGFTKFATADGTTGATNKPATLLGTAAGPFDITAGLNDTLSFRLNGVDYTVTLSAGPAQTAANVVADISAVIAGVASVATGANSNHVRLMSTVTDASSSLKINAGTANEKLGFTEGDFAGQTQVSAQEVVDRLNATSGFASDAVAYVSTINSQDFVTIESLTTGTGSSIGFSTSANSAFNPTTGVNITTGTSGDGDVGENAKNVFEVSSTDLVNGSAGTGVPGQTYTDARTGLRFTVLPSTTGSYDLNGLFTLEVSPTFNVSPSIPTYAVGGVELLISNTVGVGVNDTSVISTYNPDGVEPAIGDFYFISYRYQKQDFSAKPFQQLKSLEANFGDASAENRLTLGAYLAITNGAVLVICKQVLKVPNTNQAADTSFINAIGELASPLPGNLRPNYVVPLATSPQVQAQLMLHCEIQSNERNQSERTGFIGFASGTSPTTAQTVARSLNSSRIVAFYPDSAVITMTDELGRSFESLVDGSMFAAAVSGAAVSPAIDVATPYTHRRITGFTRIARRMDPVEANQTAMAGITVLEDLDPIIRIRHGLTTNMASVLTRLPTVTQISDYVQQQSRIVLDSFIGTKFLSSRTNEVVVSLNSLFRAMVQAEIVAAYMGIHAEVDESDITTLLAEVYYSPIVPLLYIRVTFNLRARL